MPSQREQYRDTVHLFIDTGHSPYKITFMPFTSDNNSIVIYNIDEQLIFVDVPGYGYAKVSKSQREKFGKMIEEYLTKRENLGLVIQLVDLRHNPTEDDVLMYNYLKHFDLPTLVICTKEDKIAKGKVQKHIKNIKQKLDLDPNDTIISYSSIQNSKQQYIWDIIANYIN